MKRRLLAWVLSLACLAGMGLAEEEDSLETAGSGPRAAVVIERRTGTILYEMNGAEALPMASTTKVMTALLALELGNLEDPVTCSANAFGVPGTSIYLEQGETLTLRDMLYGLMLASGNDAAVAIAEHIGGTVDTFCRMMTQRAQELGCENTQFTTPHGLPNSEHYTTARDLAQIARAAMAHSVFREIVSTQRASIPWQGRTYDRVLVNKNKLLSTYQGATGIKTGYTKAAGRCLVFGAEREGMELIGVVLNCADWFDQAAYLMDRAFETYDFWTFFEQDEKVRTLQVEGSDVTQVDAVLAEDLYVVLPADGWPTLEIDLPASLEAGVEAGDELGTIRLVLEGRVVAQQTLVAAQSAPESSFRHQLERWAGQWLWATP